MKKKNIIPLIRVDAKTNYSDSAAKIRGRTHDLALVEGRAAKIIQEIRKKGDSALLRFSHEFDRVDLTRDELVVSSQERERALSGVKPSLLQALRFSLRRIQRTQGRLLDRISFSYVANGFVIKTAPRALSSVGCYIPGGRAAYPSTVLMTAGLAKLAGVKRVVICTPPDTQGRISDSVLAAASICGVDEMYRVGGAHAIAAMAYGTETVEKVRKIVGPGGIYVSVAKRLVSANTPIDFFAGPTELVIVGDSTTDPRLAAWDLIGQAEHGEDGVCGIVTWDKDLGERVQVELKKIIPRIERRKQVETCLRRGFIALCDDKKEAINIVNALAPEHLEVLAKDERSFAGEIESAGLVLQGVYAPCAAADYCVGTDHVLPTEGYALVRGGLSVLDFVKLNWSVRGSRSGLKELLPSLQSLAYAEDLPNHYLSVESRFKK